ncbi:MAG: hypothetical protein ABSH22_17660 [Tepidisphaeraceae bacterium]
MRGSKKLIGFAALLLLVGGCVESLHALYSDRDVIYEPALIGVWTTGNGMEEYAFTKSDQDNTYKLIAVDKDGKSGEFVVHLLKVKDTMFLDLYPADPQLPQNGFYQGHLLPTHSFVLVRQIDPTLVVSDMDMDWTKKFLTDNPSSVGHEMVDDMPVLTASTADLQAFLLAHLDANGPFSKTIELTRRAAAL